MLSFAVYRQSFLVGESTSGPALALWGMQHTGLEPGVKMVEVAAVERSFWSLLGPLNPPLTVWDS